MIKKGTVNENGLTLIEVLASIVILSIVIISFLSLFSQITHSNQSTEYNLQAASIAKELSVLVKDEEINFTTPLVPSFINGTRTVSNTDSEIIIKGSYKEFPVEITIRKDPNINKEGLIDLFQMKISIKNAQLNEVGYTYGYYSIQK